jgi:hypothetical protein
METPPGAPSRLKRFIGRILFALAALVTVGALTLAEENWRGARAWQSYKRAMEAKGDQFDAARLIPPKVPDDENFAMTPLFAPLFTLPPDDPRQPVRSSANGDDSAANLATNIDVGRFEPVNRTPRPLGAKYATAAGLLDWAAAMRSKDPDYTPAEAVITNPVEAASIILNHLKTSEPLLAELQSATARPNCRFNISYEDWNPKAEGLPGLLEHFVPIKWLFRFLDLHAEAEMVSGRTDQALKDLNVMFRVDDGLRDEPLVMSQLVRMSCVSIMLEPIGEGLLEQRWSEDQLQVLQERLQKTDLIASTVRALYGERDICCNSSFDQGYMLPRGWNRFEQVSVNRAFQEAVFARIDLAGREIKPSVNRSIDLSWQQQNAKWLSLILHHTIIAKMTLPVYSKVPQEVAFAQSEVDMAMLACALGRYRMAQGQYPDDLNALVPRFVTVLPHDIINGQPLKYHRSDNGRFVLYSVGWNEKDDGGVIAARSSNTNDQDILRGDWVWQYPKKP